MVILYYWSQIETLVSLLANLNIAPLPFYIHLGIRNTMSHIFHFSFFIIYFL